MSVALTGPLPPPAAKFPLGWCTVCVMLFKSAAIEAGKEAIQAAEKDSQQHTIGLAGMLIQGVNTAAAYGIFQPLAAPPAPGMNGIMPFPVPLCWSHLMALTLKEGGMVMPASPAQMPRGPVLLGQPRGG